MIPIILLVGLGQLSYGVTLEPIYSTIDSKRSKNITYSLSNPTKDPIAVQIFVFQLVDTTHKKEYRIKTDKVSFYPTQVIINPLEEKKLRIRYNVSSLPDKEEVYRIIAKEIDVDVSDKIHTKTNKIKMHIKMRFSYEGLLFVHRKDAQAVLSTKLVKHTKHGLVFSVHNSGTKSIFPSTRTCDFVVNKIRKLNKKDLKKSMFKRILPGQTQQFSIKHIRSIAAKKIQTIDLKVK